MRKNRRRRPKTFPSWTKPIQENTDQGRQYQKSAQSRCAFCGRLLDAYEWHYMYDEFGQRVRKCNNERICSSQRKTAAEEAFREALRRNHKRKGYWIMG